MSFVNTRENFEKVDRSFQKQEERPTTYSVREDLFQINSYTDEEKKNTASASQTIQFDLTGLKDLLSIAKTEYPNLFAEDNKHDISKIKVDLLDKNGEPQYGLNWGQRIGREPNQAYIQLPLEVYRSDFFPKKPEHFSVKTDDGQDIVFTRAQKTDEGTALQTPENNSLFGKYLRTRMGIPLGDEITKEAILSYGCKEITFFKVGNQYFMDFSGNSKINIDSEHFDSVDPVPFSLSKFTNNNSLFTRYIHSILSKPFVILSGNSGTGKTRIATR
ncbi:NgoFVII family restriction endonuclease, partial [Candidatus Saccharibacteria bacterium]|nr:NgoFVII family restriction endonuclease [Candidatus Saccharibacteria bacterium]